MNTKVTRKKEKRYARLRCFLRTQRISYSAISKLIGWGTEANVGMKIRGKSTIRVGEGYALLGVIQEILDVRAKALDATAPTIAINDIFGKEDL